MGFRIVIFALSTTLLYVRVMQEYLDVLRTDGTTSRLTSRMIELHDYEELLGLGSMQIQEDQITRDA